MNPRGCFMKGNENGTTNGRGRGFLPLYKPQTKKKKEKERCSLEQGKSRIKAFKERAFLGKKKKQGVIMRLVQIVQGFWEGL